MINFTSFAEIISVCIKKWGGRDDVEEGQRRKAREKRKTQQEL